jgi:hypothetical protein
MFSLPGSRLRRNVFVRPAAHGSTTGSGDASCLAIGSWLRLKPNFDLSSLDSEAARIVARALQSYGMILTEDGSPLILAQSDQFTVNKYEGTFERSALSSIAWDDFDIVDTGLAIANPECVRNL